MSLEPASRPAGRGEAVLVVDDEPAVRRLVADILTLDGHTVISCGTALEALAAADSHPVGLVVMDLGLPDLPGLELLARLRARASGETLPIVVVTGADDLGARIAALEAGATDFVVKPFAAGELTARVKAHLRGRVAWQNLLEDRLAERAAVARAVLEEVPDADLTQMATSLCQRLVAVGGVAAACVLVVLPAGTVVVAGCSDRPSWPYVAGDLLPPAAAERVAQRARLGPWVELPGEGDLGGVGGPALVAAAPFGPLQQPAGVLVLESQRTEGDAARHLLSAAVDFAGIAGTLLAPRLVTAVERAESSAAATDLAALLAGASFLPHYQPISRLDDGAVRGVEALTRFSDGSSPEHRFREAAAAGLGPALEMVTLERAVISARALPGHQWLSLNVSAALLHDHRTLGPLLAGADRQVVLELSEHERVDDYDELRRSLDRLPDDVLLSVDDAGSGFATLRHVLLLEPDFMKLDRSWIHGIDRDPARQALVAGLRHFADRAGYQVVAEGIETPAELRTVAELGVDFGQGFLLGHPRPLAAAR